MGKGYQKRYVNGEEISEEEMRDVNECELSKEPQNFRDLKAGGEEKLKFSETEIAERKETTKGVNAIAALCAVLSALCFAAAIGVMVYFVGF